MSDLQKGFEVCVPDWATLRGVIETAQESLMLCSPYISTEGVDRVFDALERPLDVSVVTRLSPSDWANGISDPEALLALLQMLEGENWPVHLWVHQRLHAKAYVADKQNCLLGSANLSAGGFDRNFELAILGNEMLAAETNHLIQEQLDNGNGRAVGIDDLAGWITDSANTVLGAGRQELESDELAEIQRNLDRMLGRGGGQPALLAEYVELGEFVAWLRGRETERGATVLLDRHDNHSGQNLTGHVRQSYAACQFFFENNRDLITACADTLDESTGGDVPVLPDEVVERWIVFVDANADFKDETCDFAVLRGYLPPSLGGTRTGGGGGSSTLKRMLPLVAAFFKAEGEE